MDSREWQSNTEVVLLISIGLATLGTQSGSDTQVAAKNGINLNNESGYEKVIHIFADDHKLITPPTSQWRRMRVGN